MNGIILQLVLAVVPAVLAITLHEAAHGYAAWALGDDTARRAGRLSLNPLAHVDRVGTILLPGVLLISQLLTVGRVAFMFGWARPVPVAAWKFRDPRRGMMLVAAAGPAMNALLAWLGAMALYATPLLPMPAAAIAEQFLFYFMLTNLVLGLFNLLPIPPLDGGRILVGLLPGRAAAAWARLERAGLLIVLGLVFLLPMLANAAGLRFDPVRDALDHLLPGAMSVVLRLAGHPDSG